MMDDYLNERVQCTVCRRWPMRKNWANHMLSYPTHWPLLEDGDEKRRANRAEDEIKTLKDVLDALTIALKDVLARSPTLTSPGYRDAAKRARAVLARSQPEDHTLFHGHHPMCPYTIEGDWSVCDCGAARSDATPPLKELRAKVEALRDYRSYGPRTIAIDVVIDTVLDYIDQVR